MNLHNDFINNDIDINQTQNKQITNKMKNRIEYNAKMMLPQMSHFRIADVKTINPEFANVTIYRRLQKMQKLGVVEQTKRGIYTSQVVHHKPVNHSQMISAQSLEMLYNKGILAKKADGQFVVVG